MLSSCSLGLQLLAVALVTSVAAAANVNIVPPAVQVLRPGTVFKPLFQLASEMLQAKPFEVIDEAAGMFLDALDERTTYEEQLQQLKQLVKEPDSCNLCKAFIGGLKILLHNHTFEELQGPITEVCYKLLEDEGERRFEVCNGSIAIQGPHVAYIINASTPARICEFQNACFLNDTSTNDTRQYHHQQFNRPLQQQTKKTSSKQRLQNSSSKRAKKSVRATTPITLVQLTDIHIDLRYKEGTLTDCGLPICCSDNDGPGSAGPYGAYECNIPPRTIELFLQKVAQLKADFILYSGDVSGSRLWDESQQELLNISEALINAISQNVPNHTVYPSFGNHEMFPTNLYYKGNPDVVELTNVLTEWWSPIAKFDATQQETMKAAAYYVASVKPGLKLITYNSGFMYTANFYNVLNHDERTEARDMMAFVERELASARTNGEKVIIMGHHPTNSGDYLIDFGYWYKQLALDYTDVIVLHIAGHRHCDAFHLISDANNIPQSMIYLSTPITAGGTKNPAMRIYKLDPDSFQLIDYDQYYFDLDSVPANTVPDIIKLYSAKAEYNLTDLSPLSWSCLVDKMEEDSNLLMQHLNHYYIDSREDLQCNASCQREHICSLRHCTYDQHYYCINSDTPTSAGSCQQMEPSPSTVSSLSLAVPTVITSYGLTTLLTFTASAFPVLFFHAELL